MCNGWQRSRVAALAAVCDAMSAAGPLLQWRMLRLQGPPELPRVKARKRWARARAKAVGTLSLSRLALPLSLIAAPDDSALLLLARMLMYSGAKGRLLP